MGNIHKLSGTEILEIIESLLNMSARKEAEIAELKAQLDIFRPKDVNLRILDSPTQMVKGKVLLAFQSRTLREILKQLLASGEQFEVIAVERYEDAPSACAIQNPDICIFEITKLLNLSTQLDLIIEAKKVCEKVSIISILADNDVTLIRDVVMAGSDDFLVKPIDTTRMIKVVSDILLKKSNKVAV